MTLRSARVLALCTVALVCSGCPDDEPQIPQLGPLPDPPSIRWDTPTEQVEPGAQGVAGLEVFAADGEEVNIIITTVGEGPVELIRADVGLSMSDQMFSESELFYHFTQPEGVHLIQFRCADRGVQDVHALAVFDFDSDTGGVEVMNDMDLEVQCLSDVDGGVGGSGGAGGTGGSGGTNAFRYFWIADLEPGNTTSGLRTAGVDIDAVEARVNGQSYFAGQINGCGFPPFDNSLARDCNQALGPPQGTCETCDPASGQCANYVATYVSLGGDDREGDSGLQGTLVVSFEGLEVIPSGADITVYECGSTQNPIKVNERYESFVGPNRRPADDGWVRCHEDAIGNSTCTVP